MLRILRISGHSLSPAYEEGDFVLVARPPWGVTVKPRDVVVFRHAAYGTLIKRVEQVSADGQEIFVVGTHPDSTDSREFGPVRPGSIFGKVIWHWRKPL